MSSYNMEFFLADFAERTYTNYETIKHMANQSYNEPRKVYEVTQLINSFLGLVVLPNEKFKKWGNNNKRTPEMKTVENKIQAILDTCREEHRYFNSFSDQYTGRIFEVITHLRNSIAHSGKLGLHFYPVVEGCDDRISHIYLYDSNYNSRNKKNQDKLKAFEEFCLKLTIEEVEALIKYISELYVLIEKHEGKDKEYESAISLMSKLLEQQSAVEGLTIAERIETRKIDDQKTSGYEQI